MIIHRDTVHEMMNDTGVNRLHVVLGKLEAKAKNHDTLTLICHDDKSCELIKGKLNELKEQVDRYVRDERQNNKH